MPIRTRFAPSPTGYLHIGGLRTGLYQMLFAKKNKGTFILRIEDTDRTRFIEGSTESFCKTLQTIGIVPDEGMMIDEKGNLYEKGDHGSYLQSKNADRHRAYAEKLIEMGKAYPCFCTEERLQEMRKGQEANHQPTRYDRTCRAISPDEAKKRVADGEKHVIRLALPTTGSMTFHDEIRGDVSFGWSEVDDQVIIKSDGMATYHLASTCDDHDMEITHVIRGEEWISSTPKHHFIYESFGWTAPKYAHLPLLLNADRSKLSKRQRDVAVEDFLNDGYLPEAIINFVALLGWNPSGEREIYTMDELIAAFDLSKVNKSGAVVNYEKLDWMNAQYIKSMSEADFLAHTDARLAGIVEDADVRKRVALAIRERMVKFADVTTSAAEFLSTPEHLDASTLVWKTQKTHDAAKMLEVARLHIETFDDATVSSITNIETSFKKHISDAGLQNGKVLWPLRVALSGKTPSPPPFDLIYVLGKEKSLERIKKAIETLEK
jgi:nondiscriminating glutamyl-tRNA synthetase